MIADIDQLPAGQEAAEAFYRVVDAAYERRSVVVTSNLHPSGVDRVMPKALATVHLYSARPLRRSGRRLPEPSRSPGDPQAALPDT